MKVYASIFLASAVAFAGGISQAGAAEPKPIAALAIASYNDIISDINFLGGLADRPQLGAGIDGFVTGLTQGKGLAGVDKSRPFGAIVQASGEGDISGYVFLPINDFKAALDVLKLYSTVEDQGDVYKLTPKDGKQVNYVKQHGAWACFSDKAESLAHIVGDPLAIVRGMGKNYVVAGRVFLADVPDALRAKFFGQLKDGIEKEASNKKDNETDEQFAARKKVMEQTEAYLVRVAGDMDQLNFGWALDRDAARTYFDFSATAKPGTETAKEMATAAEAKTNFAGFRIPAAATLFALAAPIPEAKQHIAESMIDLVRSHVMSDVVQKAPEDKRGAAKEIAGGGLDLLAKIVKSGHIDYVSTSLLGKNSATNLGAFYVADGKLFDKIIHTVYKTIEEDNGAIGQFVKLDVTKINGLNIHKVTFPIPDNAENREKIVQYIGEKLDIVVAVGEENVYFAAGRDAGAKLKEAITASREGGEKKVAPVKVSIAGEPIAGFISAVGKPQEQATAKMVVTELKKSPGKDHVNFTVRPIENGVRMRLEVEPGLLRLIGRIVVMRMDGKTPGAE